MATFDPAFDKMIRNEGGFKLTNIEGDRGGQTYALSCVGLQSRNDSGQHVTMRIVLE